MERLRISLIYLLGLCLIFSEDHDGCCLNSVWQPPRPSISHLEAISDKRSLLVSWLVNHSSLVGDIYEIQIGRAENHTVIYNKNLSLSSVDSDKYTWMWTSDLPLECVDHSVRIRRFYNRSVPSPWSHWMTNNGVQAKGETLIFPRNPLLREHTSAMFCCVPPRGVNITSMSISKKTYSLISVGARVKAISEPNVTIPTTKIKLLTLFCNNAKTMVNYTRYSVSFPPQKPRNLQCVTSDTINVICTWDSGRKRHQFDPNKQTYTLHIENSDRAPIICESSSSCTFPAVPQLEEYNVSLVVKDQLGEEMESYSFNISDRVSPVVKVSRVTPEVRGTTVSWFVQGGLTRLNLLCQVSTDPDSTTQLNCSSVSGLCEVLLEHLSPNTHYSTRVRCSVNLRLWGEWTQPITFKTYPLVTLDVWRTIKQLSHPNSRRVTLLWNKPVPGSAATANIEGYVVQWSQEGQNWTRRTDSGQNHMEVSISAGQCDFTVQAVVHTGPSVPAHITVPEKDAGEILPVKKRLSSQTAAGFNLSWDNQDTATCGYTVEWCSLGNAVPCTLQWLKLPEGNNTLFLPARNFKAGCRYTFNIYGCTDNAYRLLEVQTGYSQELKSVQSPNLVEPVQRTSSSVTLEWSYNEDDPAHAAFITGYLVTAQEVGSVLVEDPRRKFATVDGLEPDREYVFSLSALTKEGPGQTANITIRTRTNYSAHLAKILTPILLLLCCVILLWPRRKIFSSRLKKIFLYPAGMNIKPPELDSFLQEIGEMLQAQKVEECSSCDIEILNIRPPPNETTALRDPEPPTTLPSPGSQSAPSASSPSCVPLQSDYCPQSVLWDTPALQQVTCITNKAYLHTVEEDFSEAQQVTEVTSSSEPSESLVESCSVTYGYVSSDILR